MNVEELEKIGTRHEMRCLELKEASGLRRLARSRCVEGVSCLAEVGVLPCGGGLPPLYGG